MDQVGCVSASRGLTGRPSCRRWGQSHWPPPTAGPPQGLVLPYSVEDRCAGRRPPPSYLGSTDAPCESSPSCSHPVGRLRRDVPFLTGQKGDGKSRRAGRAAADDSVPRRGRESQGPGGSSRGLARTSAMTSLRYRFAKNPSSGQSRPRRRTAKDPEEESAERRRGRRYRSRSVLRRKERRSGEDLNPRR
jgi:hypothetical protein